MIEMYLLEQLDALIVLAGTHADEYSAADMGVELCEQIYSTFEDTREMMAPFVPDFETRQWADPLPEKLADRKYLCLEITTDTGGMDFVHWRGGLYARMPERMRAKTLEEADAVLIVHGYQAKQFYQGYYYYSPYGNRYFDYVGRSETLLYDLTDGALYRTGWGARDAEIWPAFCAEFVPDAENAGLSTIDPFADPFAGGKTYEAGGMLFFGRFEQDGDADDGPEPIAWIVLDATDGELLLLSRYSLVLMPFNEDNANVRWEESGAYAWLNGTFLGEAFGAEKSPASALLVRRGCREDVFGGGHRRKRLQRCTSDGNPIRKKRRKKPRARMNRSRGPFWIRAGLRRKSKQTVNSRLLALFAFGGLGLFAFGGLGLFAFLLGVGVVGFALVGGFLVLGSSVVGSLVTAGGEGHGAESGGQNGEGEKLFLHF